MKEKLLKYAAFYILFSLSVIGVTYLNVKGIYEMNLYEFSVQTFLETNIMFIIFLIYILIEEPRILNIIKYIFINLCLTVLYIKILSNNEADIYNLLIVFFIQLFSIIWLVNRNKLSYRLNIFKLIIPFLLVILLSTIFYKNNLLEMKQKCSLVSEEKQIQWCIVNLDYRQSPNYRNQFLYGKIVIEVLEKNIKLRKQAEKNIKGIVAIKNGQIYWFSDMDLYKIPDEYKPYIVN